LTRTLRVQLVNRSSKESQAMITLRTLGIGALGLVLSTHSLQSQDRSRYRDFRLGADLSSISALTGVAASEAKTIHQRPAMLQQLQWRRPYSLSGRAPAETDPVKEIVFSFYNDQLSKMVIDYDRDRTEGLTDADVADAISIEYGPPLKPAAGRASPPIDEESGTQIARWGDAEYAVVLYRLSYASGLRLIVTSPRLEALARTAVQQASRLDEREAPQREIARQKKEAEALRVAQEKSRLTNKATFRP
jgi:hypothetical protein